MKKIISLGLILTLLLSFTACSAIPQTNGPTDMAAGHDTYYSTNKSENYLDLPNNSFQDDAANGNPSVDIDGDLNESFDMEAEAPSEEVTSSSAMKPAPDAVMPNAPIQGAEQEEHNKFQENNFIKTSKENVSTFSADVDTASYSYFRRLVEQGTSLSDIIKFSGSSIRTEEMLNYFKYSYTEPKDGELFSANVQIAPCPWNKEAALLMLGLQAKELEYAQKNNLVFLVDVSGSMNSKDKLGLLQDSFSYLVSQLGDDDIVSIVTYSGRETVVLEGCSGTKSDTIMRAIESLSASGSTNGEAGLKKAYDIAEEYYIKGGNNRIIIASDGDLNVGISSADEMENFISEKRDNGVFLSVLGFGTGNYKDAMMERIADCGNGVYYYIDSETEAEKVFGTDIFSTLYTIAKDVKLQLTFSPDFIDEYRLVGYENRLLDKEDFKDDTKDAGELGAGHSVTVCYELKLKDGALSSDSPWMQLGVRYKAPTATNSKEENYSFGAGNYTNSPNADFRFACSVIEMSMLIHQSEYTNEITVKDIKENLASLNLTGDEYKAQFARLVAKLAEQ